MAATAALASTASSAAIEDADEYDIHPFPTENYLAEGLARTRIGGGDDDDGDDGTTGKIPRSPSEESTDEGSSGATAPERGFFIDPLRNRDPPPPGSPGLPSWPATPPRPRTSPSDANRATSSCPRPSPAAWNPRARPPFARSSSGTLLPPATESARPGDDDVGAPGGDPGHDIGACPAARAAAATLALENGGARLVPSEVDDDGSSADVRCRETPRAGHDQELVEGLSTINDTETVSLLHELDDAKDSRIDPMPSSSPRRTFDAYPSKANEPIPTTKDTTAEDDDIPALYAFTPGSPAGRILALLSRKFVPPHKRHTHGGSALAGFAALLLVTCANYMLGPMRDAAALAVGVSHIPALTLASTVLALGSSVPVGWLFEAPDPMRRRVWRRMGLTRGETQGTSLALFYRSFAFLLLSYALGFRLVDKFGRGGDGGDGGDGAGEAGDESAVTLVTTFLLRLLMGAGVPVARMLTSLERRSGGVLGARQAASSAGLRAALELHADERVPSLFLRACACVVNKFGKVIYVMFFLVVHLMKLHSLSLIWGVTTEAMEYEETTEQRRLARATGSGPDEGHDSSSHGSSSDTARTSNGGTSKPSKNSLRLKRLAFVGFGGTIGGILGSVIASFAAHKLELSGLLVVAAILLELSANLSVELGRIMQRHWEEQMKCMSYGDLSAFGEGDELAGQAASSVDSSMRRSASLGSMKRVASGHHLSTGNLANLAAPQQPSGGGGGGKGGVLMRARSIGSISISSEDGAKAENNPAASGGWAEQQPTIDDNSFKQRLLRGIRTILQSRLLMAIFTYNALYASTSVLLSFQRAELVANRTSNTTSAVVNTAFLAKINVASSVAVFALQASGLGACIAHRCGQRGALALMPAIRLCGVTLLGWWHLVSDGRPPDLVAFLVIDEFTKVINFAVAKPVRENLWRGLSAEARYEAKPIVDTIANRWGGGSAAFLVSFISGITDLTGLGVVNEKNGERSIFGFPPVLLLCLIISAWWTAVSADVGNIRRKIDLELKKQQ